MATNPPPHQELVLALRRYCEAHPHAADTVEGIARFWLAGVHAPMDHVERALDALVGDGVLTRRRLADGRTLYAARR